MSRPSDELHVTIDPDCAAVALASARQYLSVSSFPGSALLLILLTASRADKHAARITSAKTAAEYLFGSVERLLRLDMSEF